MSFIDKIKKLFLGAEDLLFKNHECICCGKEVPDGSKYSLCKNCYSGLDYIGKNICKKCGSRLNFSANVCDECKERDYKFLQNRSCFAYSGTASIIIKKFKYGGCSYFAPIIAEMMFENLSFDNIDLITFVPITKKKEKSRGFNQAELLAIEISKLTKIPCEKIFEKISDGKSQASLSQKERYANLEDSFKIMENSNIAKDKNVSIIDDVFTTGTTLNVCTKEILKAKPKSVSTMTFAKTVMNFVQKTENSVSRV